VGAGLGAETAVDAGARGAGAEPVRPGRPGNSGRRVSGKLLRWAAAGEVGKNKGPFWPQAASPMRQVLAHKARTRMNFGSNMAKL